MATAKTALVCQTAKQKAESANFYSFTQACPNFAGLHLVDVQWGGDLPDVLCLSDNGKRIGVELIQWINEAQTGPAKARFKLEKSYVDVIQSETEMPPENIGMVQVYAKDGAILAEYQAAAFRKELYEFVRQIDAKWLSNPEWSHFQGHPADFTGYDSLTQHLNGLMFYSKGRYNPSFGNTWMMFRAHGGPSTPDWMCAALLDNINRKVSKYAKPQNQRKLQQQCLDEFYLLAYYDEAVLYNTLYDGHCFGFQDIGVILGQNLAVNSHPFDKVFLYSPIEKTSVLQVWPLVG